jgi:hypothetical protein
MMNFSKKREEKTISFFNAERCRKKEKKNMMIFEPLITAVATVAPSPLRKSGEWMEMSRVSLICMAAQKNLTENLQMIESFNGATQNEN